MNEIKHTSKLVKKALINHPQARNSDNYLYYVICKQRLDAIGINIDRISLSQALLYRKEYNLPPFESVRRTRQKVQEHHPELCGTDEVEEARSYNEEIVRDYARGSAI
jgi:hypothetical protein